MATHNTSTDQSTTNTGTTQQSGVSRGDQERSIESGREGKRRDRGTGLTQRRGTSAIFGAGPLSLMQRMADDMDRLFEQFGFGRTGLGESLNTVWTPQIETFRRGDDLVIRADIPGVKKDDVHVEIENDVLTISGERKEEHEENREGYFRSERSYGQFHRDIALPEGVNAEQCEASFHDGVLEISLPMPKQEERKAKRIQIR